ncbi:hypothetical protein KY328_04105 [Candidatus Woesearchaeota archaeon]|nr:hypothetical protein [Candidatus Woesearchaeota archaeon]
MTITGVLFGAALIAIGAYFLYKNKRGSSAKGYVWVGEGKDPFKDD